MKSPPRQGLPRVAPRQGLPRVAAAITAALALAAALTWPLPLRLGGAVPGGRLAGDVALNLWSLAWIYHQAPRAPLAILDANAFHPAERTLALSDLLWGQALLGLPAALLDGPVAAYGLAYALMIAASALAMAFAVRRLGGDPFAAAAAAVLFVTLPYLHAHMGHIQLQMVAPFPLVFVALAGLAARPGPRRAVAAGALIGGGAWFGAYYGLFLAIQAALVGLSLVAGGPDRRRRLLALLAAAGVAAAVAAPALVPHALGGHSRSVHQSWGSSAAVADYVSLLRPAETIGSEERELAVPLVAILLAPLGAVALWRRADQRPLLTGIVLSGLVALVLAAGPALTGRLFAWLMRLPGFGGIRAPARFSIIAAAALIVLAGVGLAHLGARLRRPAAALLAGAVAFAAIGELGSGRRPLVRVPPPPPADRYLARAEGPGAIVHLPAVATTDEAASLYMLGSRAHFRPLVNGYSGLRPPDQGTLLKHLAALPAPASLELARDLGVRFVVRHGGPHPEGRRIEGVARRGRAGIARVFVGGGARVYEIADADVNGLRPPPPPPRPIRLIAPLPFAPGARDRYRVEWSPGGGSRGSSGMQAGEAELRVEAGARPGTIRLEVDARTTRMVRALYDARFRLAALADATNLLPSEIEREQIESGGRRVDRARFDHAAGVFVKGDVTLPLAAGAHDPLTALFAIRALDLGPTGAVHTIPLNELGNPIALEITVGERSAGHVELALLSREQSVEARELRFTALLEDGGTRRVREVRAVLPIGAVILRLEEP